MFAPINSAPLNGARSGLWVEASVVATAEAFGVSRVDRYVEGVSTGQAESVLLPIRNVWALNEVTEAVATSDAIGKRTAFLGGITASEAIVSGEIQRTAWMAPSEIIGSAHSTLTGVRMRSVTSIAVSESQLLVDPRRVIRTAWADLRAARGVGQTWIDESLVIRKRVRQQYATGTVSGRARSTGIAGWWLGQGNAIGEALALDEIYSLRVTHDAVAADGYAAGYIEVDSGRIRTIQLGAIAESNMHLAPTIVRADGTRITYTFGEMHVSASQHAVALGFKDVSYRDLEAKSESKGDAYAVRGVTGQHTSKAESQGSYRTNTWFRATGNAEAVAESQGISIRYRWVGADGKSPSYAESTGTNRAYRNVVTDPLTALAESQGMSTRYGKVFVEAVSLAEIDNAVTVYGWVYVDGQLLAEAETYGDGLKEVWVLGEDAVAMAAGKAPTFKINADVWAPDYRTIFTETTDRNLYIDATDREYRV